MNFEGDLAAFLKFSSETNAGSFPGNGKTNYFHRYSSIREHLVAQVFSHVTAGAIIIDGGYLTDHGDEHVRTVIERASHLARADACALTPYESYVLLVAIHLHDVGNIFGRAGHEMRALTTS